MSVMNRPYNILQVIDKFSMDGVNPSSCAYLIRDWHRYADKERFNIIACGLKHEEPAGHIYKDEGIPVFFLGNGKYSPGNVTGLMELIDREQIDLLHLHGYSSANFGRIAARLKKIPNIVHEHAILDILPHQYVADWVLRGLTDCAVGVSDAVSEFLIKGRHVPRKRTDVVYNGVNLDTFVRSDTVALDRLRREFSLNKEHFIIGTLTRLRQEKGNEILIRAMRQVVDKYPHVRLLIAGDGPLWDPLEALIAELGLREHVRLIGFRRDVMDLLTLFDMMVVPSFNEGFGLMLVEALAMGVPVVASRVGGLIEISGEPPCTRLVSAGDPNAFAREILYLLEHPETRKEMAAKGLEQSKKFSIQNNINRLQEIYLSLLKKNNHSLNKEGSQ